jgi:hypothetical protein
MSRRSVRSNSKNWHALNCDEIGALKYHSRPNWTSPDCTGTLDIGLVPQSRLYYRVSSVVTGHFGTKTLQTQDISVPAFWGRSVLTFSALRPKCLETLRHWVRSVSRHFGTGTEMSWVQSDLFKWKFKFKCKFKPIYWWISKTLTIQLKVYLSYCTKLM